MIRTMEAKLVAGALHERYDPTRALALMGRLIEKALFTGRADDVVFWALVHAHYRGGDLCAAVERELSVFAAFIERDPSEIN